MKNDLDVLFSPKGSADKYPTKLSAVLGAHGIGKELWPVFGYYVNKALSSGVSVQTPFGVMSLHGSLQQNPVPLAQLLEDVALMGVGYFVTDRRINPLGGVTKNFKVGVAKRLPVCDGYFNVAEAKRELFDYATRADGSLDPVKARKGFVLYDAARPDLRGSYKLPIAMVRGGKPVVVGNAVRNALSRLPQTYGVTAKTMREAQAVLEAYLDKVHRSGSCAFSVAH